MAHKETLEGYLVDIEGLHRQPDVDLLTRARAHEKDRLLQARETGYGLVTDDGRLVVLDHDAGLHVAAAVRANPHERGVRVRVEREETAGAMHTTAIHTAEGRPGDMTGGKEGAGWDPWKGQYEDPGKS